MTKQEFLARFEEVLEVDPGTLTGDEAIGEIPKWDSLAVVGFIAMVDEQFGRQLSPRDIAKAQRLQDLVDLLGDGIEG